MVRNANCYTTGVHTLSKDMQFLFKKIHGNVLSLAWLEADQLVWHYHALLTQQTHMFSEWLWNRNEYWCEVLHLHELFTLYISISGGAKGFAQKKTKIKFLEKEGKLYISHLAQGTPSTWLLQCLGSQLCPSSITTVQGVRWHCVHVCMRWVQHNSEVSVQHLHYGSCISGMKGHVICWTAIYIQCCRNGWCSESRRNIPV